MRYAKSVKKFEGIIKRYIRKYPSFTNTQIATKIIDSEDERDFEMSQLNHDHVRKVIGAYKSSKLIPKNVKKVKKAVKKVSDQTVEDKFDDRSTGEAIRGAGNIISHYEYRILIRDKESLEGRLSRDEMNMVYRLYSSNDGAGLNRRSVSRYFPTITFVEFKKILRAFNITKDSIPIAPHVLEENNSEKVTELILKGKEDLVFKKLGEDRSKFYEKKWRDALKIVADRDEVKKELIEGIAEIFFERHIPEIFIPEHKTCPISLNTYFSDVHIGSENSNQLFPNDWNKGELKKRIDSSIHEFIDIAKDQKTGRIDVLNLCELGDTLDGMFGKTTRGLSGHSNHTLPQNMNNKEQQLIRVWMWRYLIDMLHQADIANKIDVHIVTDDNHSGDFAYGSTLAIQIFNEFKYPHTRCNVIEDFIGGFQYGLHRFFLTHGKDKEYMKRGLPLVINDTAENWLNKYFNTQNIQRGEEIHLVKGDLHQSAYQAVKGFDYRNTFSTYGSSDWIAYNFGPGQAGLDYDLVWKDKTKIHNGRIKFN